MNKQTDPTLRWRKLSEVNLRGENVLPIKGTSSISGVVAYGVGLFHEGNFSMARFLNGSTIGNNDTDFTIEVLEELPTKELPEEAIREKAKLILDKYPVSEENQDWYNDRQIVSAMVEMYREGLSNLKQKGE